MEKSIELAAIEARRQYQREWRQKNPEKVKANAIRYWARVAQRNEVARLAAEEGKGAKDVNAPS